MTVRDTTGEREFHVPFAEAVPGGPFKAPAELVLTTQAPGDRPTRLEMRYHPSAFEFMARLPKLVDKTGFPADVSSLTEAAADGQPLVIYLADPAVLERVPSGLSDLEGLEAFLKTSPNLFDPQEYTLAAISV